MSEKKTAPAPTPSPIGEVFLGKYRIESVLGIGGMGAVYAATNLHIDQRVAVKLLLPDAAEDGALVARFAREAQILSKIQSEHVARVLDVGTCAPHGPFMVLEHLQGDNLADVLDRDGSFDVETAVAYLLEACEAVAEAHSLGIVHRDIKPDNLFLAKRSNGERMVKVLDFGISKADPGLTGSLTSTTDVIGSPHYMSPEQLRASRDVDARSDIWSLGVTLYELLVGQGPFWVGSIPEVCAAVLMNAPRRLREMQAGIPDALDRVVMRCLAKSPDQRYANVAELAAALLPFAPERGSASCARIAHFLDAGASESSTGAAPTLAAVSDVRSADAVDVGTTLPASRSTSTEEESVPTMGGVDHPSRPPSRPRSGTEGRQSQRAGRDLEGADRRPAASSPQPVSRRRSRGHRIAAGLAAGISFCAALTFAHTPMPSELRRGISSAVAQIPAGCMGTEASGLSAPASPAPPAAPGTRGDAPAPPRVEPQLPGTPAVSAASPGSRKAPRQTRQTRALRVAHEATWGYFVNLGAQ